MDGKETIKDDELDSVAGGNRQQATVGVGNRNTFGVGSRNTVRITQQSRFAFGNETTSQGRSFSRNRKTLVQCEPEDNEDNSLQKPTCSDPTNRGKKPECAYCSAGII